MNKILRSPAILTVLFVLGFGSAAVAQTDDVERTKAAVNKVLSDAGVAFNEGLLAYQDKNRNTAGEKFNKSVEAFLYSTIQRDQRLESCYNQLIETVYLLEFPTERNVPQIKNLALTCGWTIDGALADKVAVMARTSTQKAPLPTSTTVAVDTPPVVNAGFTSQEHTPSPLDELARLELSAEEQNIESESAMEQLQYAQVAVANRSLGFSFRVHPMIQQYINYYRGRGKTTMETGLYRSGMFMRMARRIFREEGIPENVAWLGQVESAWKPSALSWASASGLWQFIPGTGARYGLRRTAHIDERNSFDEATRASARYLKFLVNRYNGNWELALAGYNSGEGNVDRAIRRAGVADFWAAYPYLPQETRNYVPNILATILIANNPNQYGFGHIRPAAPLMYDRIRVPASTSLAVLANASGSTVQYLRYLNPHLRSNVTPPEPYIINIPSGKANETVAAFRRYSPQAAPVAGNNVVKTGSSRPVTKGGTTAKGASLNK
jgi:hypothetical protein